MSKIKMSGQMRSASKALFFAMIAEMDLVVKNLINIFFVSRYIGPEGAAAYEIVMPCAMAVGAIASLGYNGVQTICAKDYGAGNREDFERHKNAGYTWIFLAMAALTALFALFREPMLDLLGANEGSEALAALSRECYDMYLLYYIPEGFFCIACCLMYLEEKRKLIESIAVLYLFVIAGNIYVTATGPSMTGYMAVNGVSTIVADLYLILTCFLPRRKTSLAAFTFPCLHPRHIKEIFYTGLPDFMEFIFAGIVYLVENIYLLSRFSESLVAGVGVFEAIDNLPEIICIGFAFLATASFGTKVGRFIGARGEKEEREARKELYATARRLTRGAVIGGGIFALALILAARPITGLFLTEPDPVTQSSAVMLTVSCALGFVFYMLNNELASYFLVVESYAYGHIFFFAEALLFPLVFKLGLGELFGVTGFCMARFASELFTFLLLLCLVWRENGKFPARLPDFRMEKRLRRLAMKRRPAPERPEEAQG